jgi:uncharacterized protein YggE
MKNFARLAAFALAALPAAGWAQTGPMQRDSQISVTGTGTVSRTPDRASFSVTIVTTDDSAATSTSRNNATYNELKAKLATAGIGESAIKTQSFNVQYVPRPKTPPANDYGQRYGYTTSRFLQIDTTVDGVGKAIDLCVAAGATDISNVSFSLRDRKGAYDQALASAVADARRQAQILATAAGMHIVRIVYITAGGAPEPRPMIFAAQSAMAMKAAPPTEITPSGPVDVTADVTVTFAIQ